MERNYYKRRFSTYLTSLFVLALASSCTIYQNVPDDDGIYVTKKRERRVIVENRDTYKEPKENYFTKELERLNLDHLTDDDIITDIDNYSSINDTIPNDLDYNTNTSWGDDDFDDFVIDINLNNYGYGWRGNSWGRWNYWNPYFDYGFYDPWYGPQWGWNNWRWNRWGWNNWGWNNWGWNSWRHPYNYRFSGGRYAYNRNLRYGRRVAYNSNNRYSNSTTRRSSATSSRRNTASSRRNSTSSRRNSSVYRNSSNSRRTNSIRNFNSNTRRSSNATKRRNTSTRRNSNTRSRNNKSSTRDRGSNTRRSSTRSRSSSSRSKSSSSSSKRRRG